MLRYMTEVGASSGRGSYAEAVEGGRLVRKCRERINRLINGESADHVVFTLNTTDALNLAIKGITANARGAHVIATEMDHNSVLRPLNRLAGEGVEWTCVPADPRTGLIDPADVRRAIRSGTVLVIVNHASNVTGTIQPIDEIGRICRETGAALLVDAAQSMGHFSIDVRASHIDLLAFPGHKGLLGPLGTGGLYLRPGMETRVMPLREGGTGSASELDVQPAALPDRYESGSQNAVGIVGLSEGVAYILERGQEAVAAHERELTGALLEGIAAIREEAGLTVVGNSGVEGRVGVVSIVHESLSPQELSTLLEQAHAILTRAGIHCAPRAHRALGTAAGHGAVRISVGPFVTREDIARTVGALHEIGAATRSTGVRR